MPSEKTPLERMQERIYQPEDPGSAEVPAYREETQGDAYGWEAPPPPPPPKPRMPWAVRFLIAAGAFFVVVGIAAALYLFLGGRSISSDRIDISVAGLPPTIASGDTIPLVVTIRNENPTEIQEARLLLSFPPGTVRADGTATRLEQYPEVIGSLAPGAEATRTVQVQLFGAQDQILAIPIRVEYRTEGSNALFVSEEEVTTTVGTSPLSVQVSAVSEVAAGQPVTLTATVRSNATAAIENVAIATNFRDTGFSITSSSVPASASDYYVLGTLAPGESKTFTVSGTLSGQAGDTKALRVVVGSANPNGTSTLGLTYAQGAADIRLARPFIATNVSFNRSSAEPVLAQAGEDIQALVTWENSLPTPVRDVQVTIELSGSALASGSVRAGGAERGNGVAFSRSTHAGLGELAAGSAGAASFSFRTKSAGELAGVGSPSVTARIVTTGTRIEDGRSQTVSATSVRTIRVGTSVGLSSVISRAGTSPEGTPAYTVALTATNSVSSVGGARVTAVVADGFTVVGTGAAGVTYDESTRTVTWLVGDLAPGGRSVASVSLYALPGVVIDGTRRILGEQTLTGTDRYTQQGVAATASALFANDAR